MNLRSQDFSFFIVVFLLLSGFLLSAFFVKEYKNVQLQIVNSWIEDQSADCAVVLTGGPGRIKEGMGLLASGAVKKLIISGVYTQSELRDLFSEWPYYSNLHEEDIVLEKFSKTTYGNALQTRTFVEGFRCEDLILVTSQLHMYRAYKTFKSVFPRGFIIKKRAVIGTGTLRPHFMDIFDEASKSLFYSMWTY